MKYWQWWIDKDVFIGITATGGDADTNVAFKNHAPFTKWITHISDKHIDTADNINIMMPMYSLIEYSDNYSDTSRSLWHFKRNESSITNAGNADNVTTNKSKSFKYKSDTLGKSSCVGNNGVLKDAKRRCST